MRHNIGLRLLTVGLLGLGVGCKTETTEPAKETAEGVEDLTIVVEADKSRILQEEQSLQANKQEFEKERERLEKERADLERKLATLSKKDKKQRERLESDENRLDQEEKKLRDRLKNFESERTALEAEKNKLLDRVSQMTQAKGGLTVAQREELLSRREKELSRRESKVAEREREIQKLQGDAVKSLQDVTKLLTDLEGNAGKTVTVVSQPAAPSAKGSKAAVQKAQSNYKAAMETKGVLAADLPPTIREQEQQAKSAMSAGDFDTAEQAYNTLKTNVDAIKVDYAFVHGKFSRITKQYPKEKIDQLGEAKRKQVSTLLEEVSDSVSDGRYDRANKKINQLYKLLEGGE